MNKTKTILISVFVAVAAAIGVTTVVLVNNQQPTQTTNDQPAQVVEQDPNIITFKGLQDETVLDQLKSNASVVTKDSAYGEYVDSINGLTGGTDGKYWAFYVNGEMAQIGAAEYKTNDGDTVEWKFE